MSISDHAKRILRELGLTEYETRAYLSLLEKGATTASKVSEHANVPYSKNYDTLIINHNHNSETYDIQKEIMGHSHQYIKCR